MYESFICVYCYRRFSYVFVPLKLLCAWSSQVPPLNNRIGLIDPLGEDTPHSRIAYCISRTGISNFHFFDLTSTYYYTKSNSASFPSYYTYEPNSTLYALSCTLHSSSVLSPFFPPASSTPASTSRIYSSHSYEYSSANFTLPSDRMLTF